MFCPHIPGRAHEPEFDALVARDFSIGLELAAEAFENGTLDLGSWEVPAPFAVALEDSRYQKKQKRRSERRSEKRRQKRGRRVEPKYKEDESSEEEPDWEVDDED